MFLTRTEYDRGVNTFSLEGRLFQVEYAIEAIKLGSTAIGVKTKEGVVLAVEKRVTSPLLVISDFLYLDSSYIEPSSVEKIIEIDEHIGCAMSGLIADARTLVEHARVETQSRPFGVSLLIAGYDENGPNLYHTDPSGTFWQCNAKAIGSGSEGADSSLQYNKVSFCLIQYACSLTLQTCSQSIHRISKDLTLQEAETIALSILKQVMEEKITPNNVDIAEVAPTYHLYTPAEVEAAISRLYLERT
ncbi:hypothetical protein J5N97_009308 [Dioscorea zingiberensis]|uniref:Proteasome alpha-type subunits domain-containing protein n=1 Tax=Dioscorea zingiberensis TaxID=325984 RepID=A0A9D5CZ22_9LILI|nr:hypothetical protein J5N97_009308 [Dioscorea zingiberensis]